MRRVVLAVAAAAIGAGAVVGLAPRANGPSLLAGGTTDAAPANPLASPSASPSKPSTKPKASHASSSRAATTQGATPTTRASSSAPAATQSQAERTITGPVVSNGWGPVQVQITVKGGRITAVDVPVTPQDGRSRFINSRAVPLLTQEAVQAQSAQVDTVSGATDTSVAFMQSLADAIQQAG